MKYIRTKNGIYDLDKSIWYEFTGRKVKMPYCEEYEKQPKLCKTADTIVELCDYIFLFDNEVTIRKITHDEDELVIQWLKECVELGTEVKLAILTDKGLIYVAKVNEEGKPELLWKQ